MSSYIIRTRVRKIELKEQRMNVRKVGEEVVADVRSLGWFVLFEGSRESVYLGEERPDLVVGQEVTIRIEGGW